MIALIVIGALAVCIHFVPRFPFGPMTLYTDLTPKERAAVIPIKSLSNEQLHPFQNGGKPLEDAMIASRWPDVRTCLIAAEQEKSVPDLRLIDWDLFRTYDEARLCLWRIFSSLASPERTLMWLQFHEPTSVKVDKYENDVRFRSPVMQKYRQKWQENGRYSIVVSAAWRTKYTRRMVPMKGLSSFLGRIDIAAQGITASWDDRANLHAVSITHSRL